MEPMFIVIYCEIFIRICVVKIQPSGMYCHVVSEQTDVSEVRTTSTIRAMIEVLRTSETSVYSNEITRSYTQKVLIFIFATVRT
jgi:hypothetical protein